MIWQICVWGVPYWWFIYFMRHIAILLGEIPCDSTLDKFGFEACVKIQERLEVYLEGEQGIEPIDAKSLPTICKNPGENMKKNIERKKVG